MVKLVRALNIGDDDMVAEIYADSKDEVVAGMTVEGAGRPLAAGSSAYTADGDVAILNSAGEWRWQ